MKTIRRISPALSCCAAVLLAVTAGATSRTVTVIEPGTLHTFLLPEDYSEVEFLVIKGTINDSDFNVLHNLVNLRRIDLANAYLFNGRIPDGVFAGRSSLEEVLFPTVGLHSIGAGVFAGTRLTSVTLPSSLIRLGTALEGNSVLGVFEGCNYLQSVTFSEGIEIIGARAFAKSALAGSLDLPPNLKTIEASAFYSCDGLYGPLVLPSSLHTLGHPTPEAPYGVFENCAGFDGLQIGNRLSVLGNAAFKGCGGIEGAVNFPYSLTAIGDASATAGVFEGCRKITHFGFTDEVLTIGRRAFFGCEKLSETITLPARLLAIGDEAFTGCTGLHGSLSIPATVRTIGSRDSVGFGVFEGCPFSGLSFASENAVLHTIGTRAFAGASITGALHFPPTLEYIGEMAFYGSPITSVTFPENLIYLGDPYTDTDCPHGVFEGSALTSLHFGNAVRYIGRRAFYGVPLEGDLTLPRSLEVLGAGAFYGCTKLTGNVALPDALRLIEGLAPHVGVGVFEGTAFTGFTVSRASRLERIGERAFYGNEHMVGSLALPYSLTYIGSGAFYGCKNLRGFLELPGSLRSIGSIAVVDDDVAPGAFEGCIGFIALKMPVHIDPERHDTVGDRAFYGCTRLTGKVSVPVGTVIGRNPGIVLVPTTFRSVYVSPDGDDANDGSSWDTPFRTLAKALLVALEDGHDGIVRLREGLYNEPAPAAPIYSRFVEIIGGYTAGEDEDPWGEPQGSPSRLLNVAGPSLRITDAGKYTTLTLSNVDVEGIDTYAPLIIYTAGSNVHITDLNLRAETYVIGKVKVSGTLTSLHNLTFSGDTLIFSKAVLSPQENPYFHADAVAWQDASSRIDITGVADRRFIIVEAPGAPLEGFLHNFDVYLDGSRIAPSLLVWEQSVTGQIYFNIPPVSLSFTPLLSSGIDSLWMVSDIPVDTITGEYGMVLAYTFKAAHGAVVEFAVRMNADGYLSVAPLVTFVDTVNAVPVEHFLTPFDRDELSGVYHYDFVAGSSGNISVSIPRPANMLRITVDSDDGLSVFGFNFLEAYVTPHNDFRFRVVPVYYGDYARIYLKTSRSSSDSSLLFVPREADGSYTVDILDVTTDYHIVVKRSDTPPLAITPLSSSASSVAPVHVSADDGAVVLTLVAPTPQPVTICTPTGRTIVSTLVTATHHYPLPSGLYLIRTPDSTHKILLP
ncbi:MAG: leucine-rich repeat domain-containing protein [Tannerellaceae bacterium]|jgi:hypothetical protein|nr:leucine-rich repeat domain-containing protein [Tannerellaceae bacterium]